MNRFMIGLSMFGGREVTEGMWKVFLRLWREGRLRRETVEGFPLFVERRGPSEGERRSYRPLRGEGRTAHAHAPARVLPQFFVRVQPAQRAGDHVEAVVGE